MFAVIFEVQPKKGRFDDYLDLAKSLKPKLEAIEGFIDVERFESRRTAGRVLSLSIWRDEKALIRWRTHALHHEIQGKGRSSVFADYHLRVGEIVSDTDTAEPLPQSRFDTTEVSPTKAVTITERPLDAGPVTASPNGDASPARGGESWLGRLRRRRAPARAALTPSRSSFSCA